MRQDCGGCRHCYIVRQRTWHNPEEIGCGMMDCKAFSDEDFDLLEEGDCPYYEWE